ncbi:uncharacterized protein [Malus domestica]|uniref:uncharacterized protein n=1 Tax=Malus domestica TaxID=3750 RepID=UPI000498D828|nr:uncharacterized protein LOC103448072 [Malus domestica]
MCAQEKDRLKGDKSTEVNLVQAAKVINDGSSFTVEKSEALECFNLYKLEVEKQLEKHIKIVRSDRGGKYFGRYSKTGQHKGPFATFLQENDIGAQYTTPEMEMDHTLPLNDPISDVGIIMETVTQSQIHEETAITSMRSKLWQTTMDEELESMQKNQASRQWNMKFDTVMSKFSFQENKINECVYLKISGSKIIFLVLYVDDILLASSDLTLLQTTKDMLATSFDMKDLGEAMFAIWLRNLVRGLNVMDNIEKPLKLYCDNKAAVFFSKNNKRSLANRLMDMKYLKSVSLIFELYLRLSVWKFYN